MAEPFQGLMPKFTGQPFQEVQIYNETYYIPQHSYFADGTDLGFFPIAYGCPGGLPEDPEFQPELMLDLVKRFESGEHSNGMPEPITVDLGHAGSLGGYPQDVKGWIIQLKVRPFNDMALYDVKGNPGMYNKMPEGSLVLSALVAMPFWNMYWFTDHGIKPSVSLFKTSSESPWQLRNTGLCHVQCLRGLPAWVIDKQGLKATEEMLYAKEQISSIIQELQESTGKQVSLNSSLFWERYSMAKHCQANNQKEVILETKTKSETPDNQPKKVAMGADIREQLKSALVSGTGDQFIDAAEAYILAIEATADQLGDPALADTAGQGLLAKLGGKTESQNKEGAGKLQDMVNAAVKQAIDEALASLNKAEPKKDEAPKLNNAIERYINDRVQTAVHGASKPKLGSQVDGADPSRQDPMNAMAADMLIQRRQ